MDFSFDPEQAAKYGLEEAIVIRMMAFWIHKNRTDRRNLHDGRTWTYNTVTGWREHFPFWSIPQMRRILDRMRDNGIILVGNYNKTPMDRTVWYAFVDESAFIPDEKTDLPIPANAVDESGKSIGRNQQIETTESADPFDEISTAIPVLLPDKEPVKKPDKERGALAETILAYLNEKSGRNFRTYRGTGLIDRIKDGYSLDDFKLVIDDRVRRWKDDPQMSQHLVPSTLFRPSNFDKYLNVAKDGAPLTHEQQVAKKLAEVDKILEERRRAQ